jgi:4-alpha-glucanotransferase
VQPLFPRESGILMHFSSLPGGHGIGDFGPSARQFVDFLHQAGQRIWQVLPIGPPVYGDSPYQCSSAFAGYPLLISLEVLVETGLLRRDEVANVHFPDGQLRSEAAASFKIPLIELAASRVRSDVDYEQFLQSQQHWLNDYVEFMVIKESQGRKLWTEWPLPMRRREQAAVAEVMKRFAQRAEVIRRVQYLFFQQFFALKRYANELNIRLMGDIPIYVALDSADVWANPAQFDLDKHNQPATVAGTPPDYFSKTGQLWGNPCYRWSAMEADSFGWWLRRFQTIFEQFDLVRLDHFRGFEAFWAIPYGDNTAENGEWIKAPGAALFRTAEKHFGKLPIVAENLGDISPEVEALREAFGFPGMAVLLFAWGDGEPNGFQPHRYVRESVAYTGTHDNDTVNGWWQRTENDSLSSEQIAKERDYVRRYFRTDGTNLNQTFCHAVMSSVANTSIIPLQDILGVDNSARMNTPGLAVGNWGWRISPGQLQPWHSGLLAQMTKLYER